MYRHRGLQHAPSPRPAPLRGLQHASSLRPAERAAARPAAWSWWTIAGWTIPGDRGSFAHHRRAIHYREHFVTNVATAGGLLFLQKLGPGKYTVDELLKKGDLAKRALERRQRTTVERSGEGGAAGVGDLGLAKVE